MNIENIKVNDLSGVKLEENIGRTSQRTIPVLEILNGYPWNQESLNYIYGLRPSHLVVTTRKQHIDCVPWRVTVLLDNDLTIKSIQQEVIINC